MSIQEVNLYLPELRPKKEWLTANTVTLAGLGFCVLLALVTVLQHRGLADFKRQLAVVESQNAAFDQRIKAFMSRPRALNAVQLDRELHTVRREIRSREQIGLIIQDQNLGNEAGFSVALQGLARQSVSNISLSRIRISRGGGFVELRGITNSAEEIPQYIQRLKEEPAFTSSQFGLLSVKTNKKNRSLHNFSLGFESLLKVSEATGQ